MFYYFKFYINIYLGKALETHCSKVFLAPSFHLSFVAEEVVPELSKLEELPYLARYSKALLFSSIYK